MSGYYHRNFGWIEDGEDTSRFASNSAPVNITSSDAMIDISPNPLTKIGTVGLNHISYASSEVTIGTGTEIVNVPRLTVDKDQLLEKTGADKKILAVDATNSVVGYIPVPAIPVYNYEYFGHPVSLVHGAFAPSNINMTMDGYRIGNSCTIRFYKHSSPAAVAVADSTGPMSIAVSGYLGAPVNDTVNQLFCPKSYSDGLGGSAGKNILVDATNPSFVRLNWYLQVHSYITSGGPYRNLNAEIYRATASNGYDKDLPLLASDEFFFNDMCITYFCEYPPP